MEGSEPSLMLYHVTMQVNLPPEMPRDTAEKIKTAEKSYAQELQRQSKWVHLWRVVGRYSNISIFDVPSHDELHGLLSQLPLYPYLDITVTPLAQHPSAIQQETGQ
jgi:muconolactone D-isomerase